MFKLLLICTLGLMSLNACEKQKQASAEVGAIPKQVIDKVNSDLDNAALMSDKRLQSIEDLEKSESAEK